MAYKGGRKLMPKVNVARTDNIESVLRRFKRSCEKAGIPFRCREIEYYKKPTTARRQARAAAVKRHLKKLAKERAGNEGRNEGRGGRGKR